MRYIEAKFILKSLLGTSVILFMHQILEFFDPSGSDFWLNATMILWYGWLIVQYMEKSDERNEKESSPSDSKSDDTPLYS